MKCFDCASLSAHISVVQDNLTQTAWIVGFFFMCLFPMAIFCRRKPKTEATDRFTKNVPQYFYFALLNGLFPVEANRIPCTRCQNRRLCFFCFVVIVLLGCRVTFYFRIAVISTFHDGASGRPSRCDAVTSSSNDRAASDRIADILDRAGTWLQEHASTWCMD